MARQFNNFLALIKNYYPLVITCIIGIFLSIVLYIFLTKEQQKDLQNIVHKSFQNQSVLIEKELKSHFLLLKALKGLVKDHEKLERDLFKDILELFAEYIYQDANFFLILAEADNVLVENNRNNNSGSTQVHSNLRILSSYVIFNDKFLNNIKHDDGQKYFNIEAIYENLKSSVEHNKFFLYIGSNLLNKNIDVQDVWLCFGIPIIINQKIVKFIGSFISFKDFLIHINMVNKNNLIDNYLCDTKNKDVLFALMHDNSVLQSVNSSICNNVINTLDTKFSYVYQYDFQFIKEDLINNENIVLLSQINDKFLLHYKRRPLFGMILSLILTILVSGYFAITLYQKAKIKHLVEERTSALLQSTNRYKTLIESLPQQIIYKDINSVFVSCNNNFAASVGLTPKEVVGKTDFDFYPRELAEKYRNDDLKVMQTKKLMEIEEKHIKNNKEITVLTVKTPFFDENQNVIGILGVFWDITEQKKAQENLAKSEERLALALDATSDGIYDWNLETGEIYFSKKFFTMLNYMPYEFSYSIQSFFDALHPEDKVYVREEMKKYIQIPENDNFELKFRMIKKTGEIIWILNKGKIAKRDKNGNAIRVVGTLSDISQQKMYEEEREKLISELETKNTELERFTYTVSHDLKSPLITIRGFLGLLEQDVQSADIRRVHEDINRIKQATERMHSLLEDLLSLSRVGRIMNPPEYVNIGELAKEVIKLVEGRKFPQIRFIIDDNFPICYGDKPRLLEVMQNLIDNAIKYIGKDNPDPVVHVGYEKRGDKVIYFVKDNGIGIEKQYHEKIFGLFEKLDQSVEGAGVGLALVKRIVELHNGEIWVESEGANKGSKFCFTINLTPEQIEDKKM